MTTFQQRETGASPLSASTPHTLSSSILAPRARAFQLLFSSTHGPQNEEGRNQPTHHPRASPAAGSPLQLGRYRTNASSHPRARTSTTASTSTTDTSDVLLTFQRPATQTSNKYPSASQPQPQRRITNQLHRPSLSHCLQREVISLHNVHQLRSGHPPSYILPLSSSTSVLASLLLPTSNPTTAVVITVKAHGLTFQTSYERRTVEGEH
ncbi:hypothetical protein GALMADRAFT_138552 [Galerina marginata CBS 339.88]|uniref:Uncharacterized protein n=1 Tax=Galerina marginata (strain CBS 339.88) TaxID=685588 RepID=A0A067T2X0_GALM3|nr:hypothetical protein GALMADRAFT_138552 [Galerina marginata CBS 339.88]